ncbi:TIGR03668 family PPOX class F420-dependent oxidoreductase [Georgenia subflava]|uniref:TIGR03668 family PPOX class F420-dependent oxidoreductase n=1 Tax=Georgenia subflava TaxID=1622177 RepID=A0A6N7EC73_9MICO|nr:TIGR03668 family PPOX class F420-dependent oxidoreductase [Georgenia subflava]MPV35699.1 TIGR03668 family PPOX class F420-dependent oxidoreductase [Georgenia subflava]
MKTVGVVDDAGARRAEEARARFAAARVARLASLTPAGEPHIVPVTFAVDGDVVWSAVDDKPKSTRRLQRLANIAAHPAVSLLVDRYDNDWSALWWVRADGPASITDLADTAEVHAALTELAAKYPQYAEVPPAGPLIRIGVTSWHAWSASDPTREIRRRASPRQPA